MAPKQEVEKKRSKVKRIICGVLDKLCLQELDELFIAISDKDSFNEKLNSWIKSLSGGDAAAQGPQGNNRKDFSGSYEHVNSSRSDSGGLCPVQSKRFCEGKEGIRDLANIMADEFLIIKHDIKDILPFSPNVEHTTTKPIEGGGKVG